MFSYLKKNKKNTLYDIKFNLIQYNFQILKSKTVSFKCTVIREYPKNLKNNWIAPNYDKTQFNSVQVNRK